MVKNGRNTVSPRRIIAGAFVFVGLFWMFFGFGNQSQPLIVTGAAVIVLAFSVRMFSTLRRTPRQWILGTGYVTEVSDFPPESRYGRCSLQLTVDAPGMPNDTVVVNDPRVPAAQWPYPGMELPIEVAADDPGVVRILWKTLPENDEPYHPGGPDSYGPDPYRPGRYEDEPPATPVAEPVAQPAPADGYVDFDLDDPPPAPAGARSGPTVILLPPDLGTVRSGSAGSRQPAAAPPAPDLDAPEEVDDVPEDVPVYGEVLQGEVLPAQQLPRQRPSPYPRRPPQPEEPARAPQPVLVGAAGSGPPDEPLAESSSGHPAGSLDEPAAGTPAGSAASPPAEPLVDDLVTTYPSAHPGPAGAINGVGVTLLVTDLDRSIAFYRDRLGFYEVDGGEGNTVLASGETRLVLRAAPTLGRVTHRSVYLNLEVADIDAVYRELRAGGVRFTYAPRPVNRTARLELWAAAFRDPDGHGVALTQWRPADRADPATDLPL